jgi:catechol 2,3-dioxygenase-like lactoylglutathione lyase family enzyme
LARDAHDTLSFTPIDTAETPGTALRLGSEIIELVRHAGRRLPRDSRSNDRWFQHLAIVVSDIDRAYAIVLREGAAPISTGPQELPTWNPNAGGIRAVYFRDPDGHPLELIQFPRGKGDPRWQDSSRPTSARCSPRCTFLGRRRSRRRRFRWRTRQLPANGAQQPDAWRQRIANVGNHSVQKTEKRCRLLVG